MKKGLGIAANSHGKDIDSDKFRNDKFIVSINCEKLLGLSFTGKNTKNSLMTVKFKTNTTNQANRKHILLFTEQIVEINGTGFSVYD